MTTPEEVDYDRAADRVGRITLALAVVGTAVAFGVKGLPWGGGFFLGSLISVVNYRWLRRLVDSLGGERKTHGHGKVFLALRYVLLGGAAYVIVRFASVSLPAVLAGVFVLTAAIMIEAAIEIVYARK
ncbi:MAG TPA: ATP synthase subunit I [Bryobacteraceae bacterium]|nr:ATP synthase subunit I [Bryobacteraceae bacterium]